MTDILLVSDHLANQPGGGSVGVAEILLASGQQRFRYDAAVSGREGVARGISPSRGFFFLILVKIGTFSEPFFCAFPGLKLNLKQPFSDHLSRNIYKMLSFSSQKIKEKGLLAAVRCSLAAVRCSLTALRCSLTHVR